MTAAATDISNAMSIKYSVHVPLPPKLNNANTEIISQGAEALVFKVEASPSNLEIVKYRPPKPWRINDLDSMLRKKRTNQESRVMQKLIDANVRCPKLISVDADAGIITMEYVYGETLKVVTWKSQVSEVIGYYEELGKLIERMHHLRIVHGDLTTSNVMVTEQGVCLIDFGLSSQDANTESKAVDLYVLERAINSTHPEHGATLMAKLMEAYQSEAVTINDRRIGDVLSRLEAVRQRGRKRTMIG